jgi:hypothetical protein
MRAHIAHSLSEEDLFLLGVLSSKLRQEGYSISTSENTYTDIIDESVCYLIPLCDVFVGIITLNSSYPKRVIEECRIAKKNKVNRVLLIEQGVNVDNISESDYVLFDRNNLENSLKIIDNKKNKSKQNTAWIIAGIVFAAVIGTLIMAYKKGSRSAA